MLQQAAQSKQSNTIFDKMIQQGEEETLTSEQIVREASNLLVAGSDTTARTLTYLIWAVLSSSDRSILSRLLVEVNSLQEGFASDDVSALPVLKCVIQETLRLYGAAPGALPRSVPKGGRELCSFYLPEGSIVSSQAYTLHRNAAIFPDPYTFKPDRWSQQSQAMKDSFMPFGGGTRICIGLHLAQMELLLGAACFFRAFGTSVGIAPETTTASMELENHFLVGPKGHACMIQYNDRRE
jgi:cytochrome P450